MKILLFISLFFVQILNAETLESRVSELELENMLKVFRFSAGLKTQSFAINKPAGDVTVHRLQTWLGTYAKVSKRLRFYSKFEAFKYLNNVEVNDDPSDTTLPADALLPAKAAVDRGVNLANAYFDYRLGNSALIFSVGRLPTMNGPPSHVWDQQSRQSTYPLLSYNAQLDGAAFSYNFISNKKMRLAARFVYAPMTHVAYDSAKRVPTAPVSAELDRKNSVDDILTALIDFEYRNELGFIPKTQLILQYTKVNNSTFEDYTIGYVAAAPGPVQNHTLAQYPNEMFDLDMLTLYSEFSNIGKMGINFNATLLVTQVHNKNLMTLDETMIGGGVQQFGVLSDTLGSQVGYAYLLGISQNLSFSQKRSPLIGMEYLHADRKAMLISFFGTPDDVTAFYGNTGHNFHFYYMQPLNQNLSFRIGYRHQIQKWKPDEVNKRGMGSLIPVDITTKAYYLNILFKI